jgi:hypothetical protein
MLNNLWQVNTRRFFPVTEARMLHAFAPPKPLLYTPLAPFYPEQLLPELQCMLKALADVEVRFERDRKRLRRSAEADETKKRLLRDLEERRRRDREPFLKRIAELQRKMRAISDLGFSCTAH